MTDALLLTAIAPGTALVTGVGAMLALVVVDPLLDAGKNAPHLRVVAGATLGAALMLALGLALEA